MVLSLARWPVKSMGGEPADELAIDGRGVVGDRAYAVVWGSVAVTARLAPRLLAWSAAGTDGAVVVTAPGGRAFAAGDPALPAALSGDLGREVALAHDERGQQDVPETVHLVTRGAIAALGDELGATLDPRRFRANVVAELDEPEWSPGQPVRIGDAELVVDQPCLRCAIPTFDPDTQLRSPHLLKHLQRHHGAAFGVYLRPLGEATIRVGDAIEIG
jgi:hypothetical protein